MAEEGLRQLALLLNQSAVATDRATQKTVMQTLEAMSVQPGFVGALLKLLAEQSVPAAVKQSAAIYLKNVVQRRWGEKEQVAEADRELVKAALVPMVAAQPRAVAKQLEEAVTLVAAHDFPKQWGTLLPDLVQKFASKDWAVITGALRTIAAILRRYSSAFKTDAVIEELVYILQVLAAPLLSLVCAIAQFLETAAGTMAPQDALAALQALRFVCKIFYSLNFVDIPEVFEDNMKTWMPLFQKFLLWGVTLPLPHPALAASDDGAQAVLSLQAAVCRCIILYAEKYDEEFAPYVPQHLESIWQLLLRTGDDTKFDKVAISGIRFLTAIAMGVHHASFSKPEVLKSICGSIVIPNIKFRPSDQELFEDTPKDYTRREIEGSDAQTRRRAATELVRGLRKHYEQPVTQLFAEDVTRMLAEYTQDPANKWQAKDAAIFLVTALAVSGSSQSQGATITNALVPIVEFYRSQILPDVQRPSTHPVIKSDCLKFIATFRKQLTASREQAVEIIGILAAALNDQNLVVSTYAAAVLERVLVIKDELNLRFSKEFAAEIAQPIFPGLFKGLSSPTEPENEYFMKAIMRLVASMKEHAVPLSTTLLPKLVELVNTVSQNPRVPTYNHYLFETVACLIRVTIQSNPAAISSVGSMVLPTFNNILMKDVTEFTPYVFQLMSVMVELSPTITAPFSQFFTSLLVPTLWERTANVPALVRLLQAYICKPGSHLSGQIPTILGIFVKLLSASATDQDAFQLLATLIQYVEMSAMASYLPQVMRLLFVKLQTARHTKLVRAFAVFCSIFSAKHGTASLFSLFESVQAGITSNVVDSLWLAGVRHAQSSVERRLCGIGITTLVCKTPEMLTDTLFAVWRKAFQTAFLLLSGNDEARAVAAAADQIADEAYVDDNPELSSGATFSRLIFASRQQEDFMKEIRDTRYYFSVALHELSKTLPGRLAAVIKETLNDDKQYAALLQMMASCGLPNPPIC